VSKLKEIDGGLEDNGPCEITIGIDQSLTGFAVTAFSLKDHSYYSWVFKADGKGVDRLSSIKDFLETRVYELMVNGFTVTNVAMEGYAYGTTLAHMAGELGAVVKLALYRSFENQAAKYPLIVPPANLKKYVTGTGRGVQKQQMLLQIYKKWGIEFMDDNAADSYALARLAAGLADHAYEVEMVEKCKGPGFREIVLTETEE
jgi:Holliday junction resolvasome RuvABC endonuclease subunit